MKTDPFAREPSADAGVDSRSPSDIDILSPVVHVTYPGDTDGSITTDSMSHNGCESGARFTGLTAWKWIHCQVPV